MCLLAVKQESEYNCWWHNSTDWGLLLCPGERVFIVSGAAARRIDPSHAWKRRDVAWGTGAYPEGERWQAEWDERGTKSTVLCYFAKWHAVKNPLDCGITWQYSFGILPKYVKTRKLYSKWELVGVEKSQLPHSSIIGVKSGVKITLCC